MLFHSSLRKDLSRSFGATVVVLSTIVMTNVLIRTLGDANAGGVNPSEIMLVMGFTVLGHLNSILTLSLFISIVSTLSRMYADSEMVIWFSSGHGLFRTDHFSICMAHFVDHCHSGFIALALEQSAGSRPE
jgi:lipopolysaccharide export system permease protein